MKAQPSLFADRSPAESQVIYIAMRRSADGEGEWYDYATTATTVDACLKKAQADRQAAAYGTRKSWEEKNPLTRVAEGTFVPREGQ